MFSPAQSHRRVGRGHGERRRCRRHQVEVEGRGPGLRGQHPLQVDVERHRLLPSLVLLHHRHVEAVVPAEPLLLDVRFQLVVDRLLLQLGDAASDTTRVLLVAYDAQLVLQVTALANLEGGT